ncbi:hypothetical protein KIN20_002389 [Parelaphostrongylus tenuis]|uniref:Uncharacterized protein n=1 Tax=Parelaphostrongylus tenuis TaxID=148309 RepID=A0AAD5QCZ7_PARTN|nr:hypothetical protein KIN20_002389 [Parelaphostrongylus tenuis]
MSINFDLPKVKYRLERKFSINITLDRSRTLNSFKKVEWNVVQHEQLDDLELSVNSAASGNIGDENQVPDELDLTSSPLHRFPLNSTRSEDASPGPSRPELSFEQDIVDVPTASREFNSSPSQVLNVSNQWQLRLSKMAKLFKLRAINQNRSTGIAPERQKVAVEKSKSMPQDEQLLVIIKKFMERELNELIQNCRNNQLQIEHENGDIMLSQQDCDNTTRGLAVPIAIRKEFLKKATEDIDVRLPSSHRDSILRQLIEVEAVAAVTPETYADSMLRLKNTVGRRVHDLGLILP